MKQAGLARGLASEDASPGRVSARTLSCRLSHVLSPLSSSLSLVLPDVLSPAQLPHALPHGSDLRMPWWPSQPSGRVLVPDQKKECRRARMKRQEACPCWHQRWAPEQTLVPGRRLAACDVTRCRMLPPLTLRELSSPEAETRVGVRGSATPTRLGTDSQRGK